MIPPKKPLYLHSRFGIEYQGRAYSSEQLELLLDALCLSLQGMGYAPGMVVASTAPQRWLNALLLFALPRMGCIFFPVDPALSEHHRQQLLSAAQADKLLFDDGCLDLLEAEPVDRFCRQDLEPGALQLLLATSGTQGQPRVVELVGQNLLGSAQASQKRLGLGEDDVWLASLPLHHIGGLSILLRCAQAGARAVLMDGFDPAALKQSLVQHQVTHLSVVPTMLHRLLDDGSRYRPPTSLRVVLLGGAAASPELVKAALQQGWPVCPTYGLTEAASQVATLYPPPQQWRRGCVGAPLEHMEINIDQGSGSIQVRGASVAAYARGADGQRRKLLDEQGWLDTGDLGWQDAKGWLHIIGRGDDVLISGGENIHPQQLEQELRRCPGVEEVAVSAVEDALWGDALVALYCGAASTDQVCNWAKQHLKGAFVPKFFFRTENLPRNAMGKLLRTDVRKLAQALFQAK